MSTILVVDDELGIVGALTDILRDEGHEVFSALNGKAGLDALEHCVPDLMIIDVMMPLLDGKAMLHCVRTMPTHAQTPVVIMSGVPKHVAMPPSEKMSTFTVFLRKPFSLNELFSTMDVLLQSQHTNPHTHHEISDLR